MRKVQLLGVAIVAMMAFSAIAVSSAVAAAPEWLNNGSAIASPVAAVQSGTLTLTDLKAKVSVECAGTGEGTVGPAKVDVQTELVASQCNTKSGTCPSPLAKPVGLPWTTELAEVSGKTKDPILSKSGYEVVCAGIIDDTCESTASAASVLVTKLAAVVEEEFKASENENIATCSLGGKEGDVAGSFTVKGKVFGNTISIN